MRGSELELQKISLLRAGEFESGPVYGLDEMGQ